MFGLPFDHRSEGDDRVDVVALEELLDGQRHVEYPGHLDDLGDLDAEELGLCLCPLHHEHGNFVVEFRHNGSDLVCFHSKSSFIACIQDLCPRIPA